jgi:hypothetical protein
VARSVNDVDLGAVVSNGGVLSENRDAAFFFQWIGVHDKHPNVLMSAEHMPLLEQGIHQSSLPMIDVGDNGNVSDFVV